MNEESHLELSQSVFHSTLGQQEWVEMNSHLLSACCTPGPQLSTYFTSSYTIHIITQGDMSLFIMQIRKLRLKEFK